VLSLRALFLTVALSAAAVAQTASAPTISVVDENGRAVSAAWVYLETPARSVTRCLTDFTGRCSFPSVSPGVYQLRVEKQDYYATVKQGVRIERDSAIEVTISHQQEVREVVNVQESPPAIDPAQVASRETLSGLDVINIVYPNTNDYRNALNFIPGVVQDQSGQPHVAGAQTYQTETLLDGFNVTQPANGQLLVRVSTDAFRSIQIEPSREPAEDGKGSGGTLDLNTGIGDDHFRFWGTDFIPSVQNKHGWRFDQFLPQLTFSGPVRKGRMWFYNAFDGEYDNLVYTELPIHHDNDHVLRFDDLFKIQTNLASRNILTTSFLFNHLHDRYAFLSPINPQLSTPKDIEAAYVGSIKDSHYFRGNELLETGFAFDEYDVHMIPYGNSSYYVNPNTTGGSYYLADETHAARWQGVANLFLPSHQWLGKHDFKLGVDLDRISYNAQFARQPISYLAGNNQLTSPDECLTALQNAGFPCTRYSTFTPAPLHQQFNAEVSGYVEDRWSVNNRLLIEPGIRLDWDQVVRRALISPRLAGTYVLTNAATTKFSAGIGIVYDETPIFLIARPYAGTREDTFYKVSSNCVAACVTTTGPLDTTFSVKSGTLESPRFLNWSVGLEQKLPAAIYVKAEYLQKRGTQGFVYDSLRSGIGGHFFLENTRQDHYDAFQITLRHNFRESYSLMGSYTRSHARSNQALDFNVDTPVLSAQQPGPYLWDTPNRLLSWGYLPLFPLPIIHQFEVAYSMEVRNGFPYNLLSDQQELIGKPGAQRFPEYVSLNLQLEKRFHLLGYYLALRGGFDNITGRCNPFVVNNVIDPVSHPVPTFSACEGRAFTSRIRLLGRK
jgi:hypothetical protein